MHSKFLTQIRTLRSYVNLEQGVRREPQKLRVAWLVRFIIICDEICHTTYDFARWYPFINGGGHIIQPPPKILMD